MGFMSARREIVLAVLLVDGHYVLQLRDDRPDISSPGLWGLFGGGIEPGEDPLSAVGREVEEEICVRPQVFRFVEIVEGTMTRHHVFEADITEQWGQHRLMEGQATQCFEFGQLSSLSIATTAHGVLHRHHANRVTLQEAAKPATLKGN